MKFGARAMARDAGIGDGYTVPYHVPGERSGSCSFAVDLGERFPRSDSARRGTWLFCIRGRQEPRCRVALASASRRASGRAGARNRGVSGVGPAGEGDRASSGNQPRDGQTRTSRMPAFAAESARVRR
ncbi:autoinducer binding domain-containing protein [Hephaestia caeni]|uniref:autoinducer binding domain-containing protein n=1 Tax=Hephaestia caeni TaxID=645617 RepID=UPI000E5B3789